MIREMIDRIISGIVCAGGAMMLGFAIMGETNWYFGAVVFAMQMIAGHPRGPK